jgi:hypothetical protein
LETVMLPRNYWLNSSLFLPFLNESV